MSTHTETPGCLIHSSLAETGKCRISVQFYHSETVPHSHCGTHRMREMSRSVCCKHLFSSPISASNKGSNIADPPFGAFSVCITAAQPCSSTHRTKERQTIFYFQSGFINLSPYQLMFYNSSENGPWNNWCQCLQQILSGGTSQALSAPLTEYVQKLSPNNCEELSNYVVWNSHPTAVTPQHTWSKPRPERLRMPASHPGHLSVLVVAWRNSQCNLASTTATHDLYNLMSQEASTLLCTVA